jgi:sterol desaturase/sphingolipid hydroxylase (fatty acid hydroxylase superfamily)
MEDIQGAIRRVLAALEGTLAQLNSPSVSVYWGYLASALLIASLLYLLRDRRGKRASLRDWIAYCFPRRIYRSRSFFHDLASFVINTLLYSFLMLGPMTALSGAVGSSVWQGLTAALGEASGNPQHAGWRAALTVAALIAADLAFFCSHWMQHKVRALWEFHKVHHSAAELDPFTVFRRHPVDILFEGAVTGIFVGATYGLFFFATGARIELVQILGTNAVLFVFLLAGFNLQHSHIWWSFGPLDQVFISPAAHQVHHSVADEHLDRNFGNVLSLWDRLAGTFVRPRKRQTLSLGLLNGEHDQYDSLWRLYWLPFAKCGRLLFGRSSKDVRPPPPP